MPGEPESTIAWNTSVEIVLPCGETRPVDPGLAALIEKGQVSQLWCPTHQSHHALGGAA